MIDAGLMIRVADGDEAAFAELDKAVHQKLYFFFFRWGFRDESHDLTQIVLIRMWNQAHDFNPERAKVETWMYGIAHYVALQERRRQLRSSGEIEDFDRLPIIDHQFSNLTIESSLLQALAQLPATHRICIELIDMRSLSIEETAEILELAVATVRSLHSRAMEGLREKLVLEYRARGTVEGEGAAENVENASTGPAASNRNMTTQKQNQLLLGLLDLLTPPSENQVDKPQKRATAYEKRNGGVN